MAGSEPGLQLQLVVHDQNKLHPSVLIYRCIDRRFIDYHESLNSTAVCQSLSLLFI